MSVRRFTHSASGVQRHAAATSTRASSVAPAMATRRSAGRAALRGTICATSDSGSMGASGSTNAVAGSSWSRSAATAGSSGSSERPGARRFSMVWIRLPVRSISTATVSGAAARCSPSRRLRTPAIQRAMRSSPRDSMATLHSVSSAMERLLRFAEPMVRSRSSTTITLLWTLRQPCSSAGMAG